MNMYRKLNMFVGHSLQTYEQTIWNLSTKFKSSKKIWDVMSVTDFTSIEEWEDVCKEESEIISDFNALEKKAINIVHDRLKTSNDLKVIFDHMQITACCLRFNLEHKSRCENSK